MAVINKLPLYMGIKSNLNDLFHLLFPFAYLFLLFYIAKEIGLISTHIETIEEHFKYISKPMPWYEIPYLFFGVVTFSLIGFNSFLHLFYSKEWSNWR